MSKYPNSGILSKNGFKTEDKHPDIKGKIDVEGVEYDLAGWAKQGKDGKSFYSMKVSLARVKEEAADDFGNEARRTKYAIDDEIPF